MEKKYSFFCKRKLFSIGFLAMFIAPLISCSDQANEFFPRKKLLESVINFKIKPVQGSIIQLDFSPSYPGRYVIYLVLNNEHLISDEIKKIALMGSFQVTGKDDAIICEGTFNEKISRKHAGVTLAKFEINRNQMDRSKTFKIVFSGEVDQLNQQFSETTLHVKKELKNSIFD